MAKVLASTTSMLATKDISFWPVASFAAQRLIEATQSSAVTGWPSCQARPSRSVKVWVSLSADTSYLSTICGLISPFASVAEQRVVDHVAVVADDVGGGPDRIEDLEVRVHHGPQRLLRVGGCNEAYRSDGRC